jgi:phosphoesterase RecJ-like protein
MKSDEFKLKANEIFEGIKKAENILLHLHVKPDPDSIGSALAMYWALSDMGKNVTVIKGDTPFVESLAFLPGAEKIIHKNYFEIDLSQFDTFIILDSGSKEMISREGEIIFPENLNTIVIDHHKTNSNYGKLNLVDIESSATAELLFHLFKIWDIKITKDIAANLYIGIFGDTGSFSYSNTTANTLKAVAELVEIYPGFRNLIESLDYSHGRGKIDFEALALNSIETFFDNRVVMSSVSYEKIREKNIDQGYITSGTIPGILIKVKDWKIGVSLTEKNPQKINISFRSKENIDVSKMAELLGGGGHAPAAGAFLEMSLDEAKQKVIEAIGDFI